MVHRPGQKADVDHLPGWLTNNQRVLVGDCPMSTEINPEGLFLTLSARIESRTDDVGPAD